MTLTIEILGKKIEFNFLIERVLKNQVKDVYDNLVIQVLPTVSYHALAPPTFSSFFS